MACVSLLARHQGTSRKHDARDLYSPQPPRVWSLQIWNLEQEGKNSGSYMPKESQIVKKEKPENPYYFHI